MSPFSTRWQSTPSPTAGGLQLRAVLLGVIATFLVSLATAGATAIVVYGTPATEQSVSILLFALGLASLVLGAGYAAHLAQSRGWVHGLAVGLCYVALSLCLEPLLFPGAWSLGGAVQRLAFGVAAGLAGGVLGVNV